MSSIRVTGDDIPWVPRKVRVVNLAGGADGWENKVGASKSQPLGDITEDFAPRHGLEDVIALSYGAACRRCDGDLACVCQLCAAETAS